MIKQNILLLILLLFFSLSAGPFKTIQQTDDKITLNYQLDFKSLSDKYDISLEQFSSQIKSNYIQLLDSALTIPVIQELISLPVDHYQLQIVDIS